MNIVKKVSILVGAVVLAMGVNTAVADTPASFKVAVVNVQQILQQSPRVAELSKKLEGQFKGRQTTINGEQKSLEDALDKFKKDAPSMSQKDRDATQKKIAADRADLVKQVVAYQQDLQKEQNKIMQSILADLNAVVTGIAKTQSLGLVLDSQAVVYSNNGTDITPDVAKQFNNK